MSNEMETIVTILITLLASSGFWLFLTRFLDGKDAKTKMLLGLAHDRIIHLGMVYVDRGFITQDEYENLHDYLYKPYEKLNGNGSAKRIMKEVDKIPIQKNYGGA